MPFEVQEESSDAARERALEIFNSTREVPAEGHRFDWLYLNNPDGPAVLWTIRDTGTGEMAGFTVALPRRMIVAGKQRLCWNCADFSILPKYRSLGVALKLRRAAKDGVDSGRVDFLYAHPNERMAAIHSRVGHLPLGRMVRYASVLRSATFFEKKVRSRALATVMGSVVDPVLRAVEPRSRPNLDYETRVETVPRFDERFDELHQQCLDSVPAFGVRDARYLKWRYGENPLEQTRAIVAEEDGRLRGYLLFTVEDNIGIIKDLFPTTDAAVSIELIGALGREARQQGLASLSATLLEGNPITAALSDFGFRERPDSSQMFVYAPPDNELAPRIADAKNWCVTVGDRDV